MKVNEGTLNRMQKAGVEIEDYYIEIYLACKKCQGWWMDLCLEDKSGMVGIWNELLECPNGCNSHAVEQIKRNTLKGKKCAGKQGASYREFHSER